MKRTSTTVLALSLAVSGALGLASAGTAQAATGTPWAGALTGYCDGSPITSNITMGSVTLDALAVPRGTNVKFVTTVPELHFNVAQTVPGGSGSNQTFDIPAYGQTVHVTVTANGKTLVKAQALKGTCQAAGKRFAPQAVPHVGCAGSVKVTSAWKVATVWIDNVGSKKTNLIATIKETGRADQKITVAPGKGVQVKRTSAPGRIDKITVIGAASGYVTRTLATATVNNTGAGTCKIGAATEAP